MKQEKSRYKQNGNCRYMKIAERGEINLERIFITFSICDVIHLLFQFKSITLMGYSKFPWTGETGSTINFYLTVFPSEYPNRLIARTGV